MNDPWFAWLHPLSHLVVRIDVVLEDHEDTTIETAQDLLLEARHMLRPQKKATGSGTELLRSPATHLDVVLAHASVKAAQHCGHCRSATAA